MVEDRGRPGAEGAIGTEAVEEALAAGTAVTIDIMPSPVVTTPDPATRRKAARPRWEPFDLGAVRYTFDHLGDFAFTCRDADGGEREVLVVFTDHVFTRNAEPGDRAGDAFPDCSRTPHGYVCPTRYRMSFQLPALIEQVAARKVWLLTGADRYAHLPVVDDHGRQMLYAVIFTLDRLKGREQPLVMRVRSAHLYDRKPPDTFGEVKFERLVKLRLENKHPPRINDRGRRRPRMP